MWCPECGKITISTKKPKVTTWTLEECDVCIKTWVRYHTDKIMIYEMPITEVETEEETSE